jgi:tRNA (guanine-N7-)-methyltransferase
MTSPASPRKALDTGDIGLTADDLPALGDTPAVTRFDPRTLWPPDRRQLPLELEIGSGKGTFLVQQAVQLLQVNYLGIEYAREFWRYAADRCRRQALSNVRLLHYDAKVFVTWYAADAVFRQIHIYFPDPWPKKRHHKRRLIEAGFLRECHRVLEQGGLVRIVTDHSDYFAWIEEHAAQVADLLERLPFERPVAAGDDEIVGTNFERKYRREGRPFHAMVLHRR